MSQATTKDFGAIMAELGKAMEAHAKRYVWGPEIKWPIEINGVDVMGRFHDEKKKVGQLVMVRLCDESKETHLGIYLGDFPIELYHQLDKDTGKIVVHPHLNPTILVPKLKRIVWGCESFWGPIENEAQLRQVTDNELSEIWYVKLLREQFGKEKETAL